MTTATDNVTGTSGQPTTVHTTERRGLAHVVSLIAMCAADIGVPLARRTPIGMRKDEAGRVVPIKAYDTPRVNKGQYRSTISRRAGISPALLQSLPDNVRKAHDALRRAEAQRLGRSNVDAAEETFKAALASAAAPIVEAVENGCRLTALPASDLAVYFLASVFATLQRQIEVTYALPHARAILPVTVYGTMGAAYTDFIESEHAGLAQPHASAGGGIGTGGHIERAQFFGPLHRFRETWRLDNNEIEYHDEVAEQAGAPPWNLMDRTIGLTTAAAIVAESKLIAFGSNPGTIYTPGADATIGGILYMATPSSVVMNNANGEVNYNAIAAFIRTQHAAAQWSQGLMGNVLTLSPSRYSFLSQQFVNSAGSTVNVIRALLENIAGLDEIRQAREYDVNPTELARLQALGHPLATFYQGGVSVGGVQKEAVTLHRDDAAVVTTAIGHEPMVIDNGMTDGVFSGVVACSVGGCRAAQPLGLAIGYQA